MHALSATGGGAPEKPPLRLGAQNSYCAMVILLEPVCIQCSRIAGPGSLRKFLR